jgi:glutamate synthase (NADPH/NADH)
LQEDHKHLTGSELAAGILRSFNQVLPRFVRVMPLDYKAVLEKEAAKNSLKKKRPSIAPPPSVAAAIEAVTKKNEPSVVDLEDSLVDEPAAKKRVETLDKVKGFMKYKRLTEAYRNPRKRIGDFNESASFVSTHFFLQLTLCPP